MKRFTQSARTLSGLALTTVASGAAFRAADSVTITKVIFQPITRRAARRTLTGRNRLRHAPQRGRFTRADVDRLISQAWATYAREALTLPPQPTHGSRLNVRLACLTVGLFRALLEFGTERAYAVKLVADTIWNVYRYWGLPGKLLAHVRPDAASRRVYNHDPVPLRFPFNPPGYLAKPVPLANGLGFDMVRCAVATYFREQGAINLCLGARCNLDYALGEMTGQKLVRTKTLVEGDDRCDFRWYPASSAARSSGRMSA